MTTPPDILPASLAELTEAVAEAVAEGTPLAIEGAGTKRGLGRPVAAKRTLSTARLAGVDLYEPDELVMSAGAGTPLAVIQAMLAERQQELAFEPPDYGALLEGTPGRQTIGGVFACNLAGPRRPKAGAARDHLLGVQCVTGRGEAIKTGGRVVKNVTGYDVCKLLAGSYGTLAVMSRVTFKVLPRAETAATLLLRGPGEPAMLASLRRAVASPFEVSGAACLTTLSAGRSAVSAVRFAGQPVACIRLEGPAPSVAARLEGLTAELAADGAQMETLDSPATATLWSEIRDVALLPPRRPLWRLSLPPADAGELSPWLAELSAERLYDWGGGLVWLAMPPEWAHAAPVLRRAFVGRSGHATLVRAPVELRGAVDVFEPQPPALAALSRRVKESFDPLGVLNAGRMYPEM